MLRCYCGDEIVIFFASQIDSPINKNKILWLHSCGHKIDFQKNSLRRFTISIFRDLPRRNREILHMAREIQYACRQYSRAYFAGISPLAKHQSLSFCHFYMDVVGGMKLCYSCSLTDSRFAEYAEFFVWIWRRRKEISHWI